MTRAPRCGIPRASKGGFLTARTIRRASLIPAFLLTLVVVFAVASAQAAPGDLDTSFGTGGRVTTSFGSFYDEIDGLALQSDGKIVAGGYVEPSSTNSDFGLARYNLDGSLDTSFGTGGKATTAFGSSDDWISGVTMQPDGKILAAGRASVGSIGEFGLARYNTDGSLDTSFGAGGKVTTAIGSNSAGRGLALQPDGKIVVSGYTYTGSTDLFALARYKADGSLDSSFGTGGTVTTAFAGGYDVGYRVALQPDGKILVVGFDYDGTRVYFALARYDANGSLDTSFGSGGKVTTAIGSSVDSARDVKVQADGKIVAVGYGYSSSGSSSFTLVRYNTDGSFDTGFGTGGKVTTGFPGSTWAIPYAVEIQPNGRIVAAGYAKTPSGTAYVFALARYNTSGSLDTSFGTGGTLTTAIGAYNDYILDIVLQPDGRIVAGGSTPSDNTSADFALTRYLGDSHTLTVSKRGSGKGMVASTPLGIKCGSTCSAQFADASSVTLTATPKKGSVLSGWSGSCSGKKKTCELTMSADRSATAEFSRCVVPKVKGKTLVKARKAIKKAHCSVGRVKQSFSRKIGKGRVSAQKPKPGTKLRAGAKVDLTISKGRR